MLFNLVQKFSAAADAKEMKHKKKKAAAFILVVPDLITVACLLTLLEGLHLTIRLILV